MVKEETAPIGMRNMAKKRAPMLVLPAAIAFPTAAIIMRQKMWMERSWVLEAVKFTTTDVRKVANQTVGGKCQSLEGWMLWVRRLTWNCKKQSCDLAVT